MPIIHIAGVLIVVGLGLYLVNTFLPMAETPKKILNVVVAAALVVWLLQVFGLIDTPRMIRWK